MFEGDSVDTCARKFPLMSTGGRAETLACADPEAKDPHRREWKFQLLSFIDSFIDNNKMYVCIKSRVGFKKLLLLRRSPMHSYITTPVLLLWKIVLKKCGLVPTRHFVGPHLVYYM